MSFNLKSAGLKSTLNSGCNMKSEMAFFLVLKLLPLLLLGEGELKGMCKYTCREARPFLCTDLVFLLCVCVFSSAAVSSVYLSRTLNLSQAKKLIRAHF